MINPPFFVFIVILSLSAQRPVLKLRLDPKKERKDQKAGSGPDRHRLLTAQELIHTLEKIVDLEVMDATDGNNILAMVKNGEIKDANDILYALCPNSQEICSGALQSPTFAKKSAIGNDGWENVASPEPAYPGKQNIFVPPIPVSFAWVQLVDTVKKR